MSLRSRPLTPGFLPMEGNYDPRFVSRSPISGRPYVNDLPPMSKSPFEVVKRNERFEMICPFKNRDECDYSSPSGIQMLKHVQTEHVSSNEPVEKINWFANGVLTDVAGLKEKVIREHLQAVESWRREHV